MQRFLNAAARIISNTRKCDRRLSQFYGEAGFTGFRSGSVSRCSSVCTTSLLDTCRHSANPCLAFLVASTSARLIVANWATLISIHPRSEIGRLPTPVLQLGTHSLTISETLVSLYQHLDATLRLSSLSTSTLSAFDVFYKIRYISALLLRLLDRIAVLRR